MKFKHILKAILYLSKDQTVPATQRLSESVLMKAAEPCSGKGINVKRHFFTQVVLPQSFKKEALTDWWPFHVNYRRKVCVLYSGDSSFLWLLGLVTDSVAKYCKNSK